MDYTYAHAAARRAGHGVKFKIAGLSMRRRPTGLAPHRRLSRDQVTDIRRWAAGPGFGLARAHQAQLLHRTTFRHVAIPTLIDVLANHSWFDPAYVPGQPDAAYWDQGQATVAAVLLHTMERHA
jgi:hypothetical protein